MRTFTVQLPLEPLAVGQVVDRAAWPPHITLIGNFLAHDDDTIAAAVERFAATTPPVSATVESEAWFEPHGSVLVDLVEVPVLRGLHVRLLDELEAAVEGLELTLPDHTRDGYWPHRTVTAGPRPSRGDVLEARRVAFAELDPPGRPGIAVVLGSWPLTGARRYD